MNIKNKFTKVNLRLKFHLFTFVTFYLIKVIYNGKHRRIH